MSDKHDLRWVEIVGRPPIRGESEIYSTTIALFEQNDKLIELVQEAEELIGQAHGDSTWGKCVTQWQAKARRILK